MYQLGPGGEAAVGKIKEIARNWGGKEIEILRESLEALGTISKSRNDKATTSSIDHELEMLGQKAVGLEQFVNSPAGRIVGAEMLTFINYHPEQLFEPIIVSGADFVIDRLVQEHAKDVANEDRYADAPKNIREFRLALMESNIIVTDEMRSFRNKALSIQKPDTKVQN